MSREPLINLKKVVGLKQQKVWIVQAFGFFAGLFLEFSGSAYRLPEEVLWAIPSTALVIHAWFAFEQERTIQRPLVALIPLVLGITIIRTMLFIALLLLASLLAMH